MAPCKRRPLTATEERVALLAAERTDAEVAVELAVSEKAVAWHLARAARKLGVESRTDLVAAVARAVATGVAAIPEAARSDDSPREEKQ